MAEGRKIKIKNITKMIIYSIQKNIKRLVKIKDKLKIRFSGKKKAGKVADYWKIDYNGLCTKVLTVNQYIMYYI